MSSDVTTDKITQLTGILLEDDPGCFLVEVKIVPTGNVKVFLDADDGVSIDKCVKYNRALYKLIEEKGVFPDGNFSLEVSSPGLEEPLKLIRQYRKNVGRDVEVRMADGRKVMGKLTGVNEDEIQVEEVKGKKNKPELLKHTIRIDNIKTTKIQIQF